MASDPTSSESGPGASDGSSEPVFSGPRGRWTEIIRRSANRHQTALNLLKAIVLTYLFLVAINMMGVGIRLTAINPAYPGLYTGDIFDRAANGGSPSVVAPAALSDADRTELRPGLVVGALGPVCAGQSGGTHDGLVAFKQYALPAVIGPDLPSYKLKACHAAALVVTQVNESHLVVEPICEYKDWLYEVFGYAQNPFLALLVGILITAVFQSSSFTTSFTVGLVATIDFPLACAIPLVMGANVGTSVTCILVSLGYIRRRDEFRRAFAGATVHDFFKLLTVVVLFPLELTTGALHFMAEKLAGLVYHGGGTGVVAPKNFIKEAVHPVVSTFDWLLADALNLSQTATGTIMTVAAVVLLFVALLLLVKVLKQLVLKRAEAFFDRVLFRNGVIAFAVGLVLTAAVQSSSVTTSLAIPLIAAGLLTMRQVFPYFLGANIGTTVTALIAAFATGAVTQEGARLGLTLACVHTLFNVIGAAVFYPLRWIPIGLANGLAEKAAESRRYGVAFVLGVFFGVPLVGIAVYWFYTNVCGG